MRSCLPSLLKRSKMDARPNENTLIRKRSPKWINLNTHAFCFNVDSPNRSVLKNDDVYDVLKWRKWHLMSHQPWGLLYRHVQLNISHIRRFQEFLCG